MSKIAIVATIRIVPGKRDEYLPYLRAHAQRCLSGEPGTLTFDILLPRDEPDAVMLYEVYDSAEALQAHVKGTSMAQVRSEVKDLELGMTYARCERVE